MATQGAKRRHATTKRTVKEDNQPDTFGRRALEHLRCRDSPSQAPVQNGVGTRRSPGLRRSRACSAIYRRAGHVMSRRAGGTRVAGAAETTLACDGASSHRPPSATGRRDAPPPPTLMHRRRGSHAPGEKMLSFGPAQAFSGCWDHRPAVPSPLSSSPLRASSPLSPVHENTLAQRQTQSSPIQPPRFKYASRPARPNPVMRRREEAQESRRRGFLQGVRQKADDKAWQRRDIEGQVRPDCLGSARTALTRGLVSQDELAGGPRPPRPRCARTHRSRH